MKSGYLYNKVKDDVDKDVADGIDVTLGIDANSLLNTINVLEVVHEYNTNVILAELKKEVLLMLGKIEIKENQE